jgi:prevent-host-death family protein
MDVGIRELKARLSHYVDRAANGEILRITDRGRPRAVIMPLPASDHIDRGLAEGWIRRERVETPTDVSPIVAPPGPSVLELLDDDRGE